LQLDELGPGVGTTVADLPERLPRYDLVFATARMAIEAMAVGCAVVAVDERGLAGLVTSEVVDNWRWDNFGKAVLTRAVEVGTLITEIARYDADDAARVAANVRAAQSLEGTAARYEQIYREVIAAHVPVPADQEARELSRLMRQWLPLASGLPPVTVARRAAQAAQPPPASSPPAAWRRFFARLRRSIAKRTWDRARVGFK
jgi:hypothetical protein